MRNPLLVLYATVVLDAIGIGLVFPILPALVGDLVAPEAVAPAIGVMAALYAAMQFAFSPLLGALSDRLGRRPVLIVSLAGSAINYLFLALAPGFGLLLAGRAIAGLTGANMSVATAYLADISPEETRARRFGLFNAMFGAGFIIGPVLGGVLGDYGLRLPFVVAAALTAGNLLLALFVLPEPHRNARRPIDLTALDPFRPLRSVFSERRLLPFLVLFFALSATGEAYGTCWALWGGDAFHWNGRMIGLSLGFFGLCQSLSQAFLPGPAVKRLGERGAVLAGIGGATLALAVMAFATDGWMVFAIMPVFTLTGIGTPALQALASRQVASDRQGEFQGLLASTISLASIIAPLAFSSLYFSVRAVWPGAVWLSVIVVFLAAIPLVLRLPNSGPAA
jgi:DHA1 family tetracycline resistance protein-like MFS transporter